MKTLFISALLLVGFTSVSLAQKSDFSLQLSKNVIEVKAGGTSQFTVDIVRGKTYTKSKAKLGFSSRLPEGITVTFEPAEGLFNSSTATITTAETVKPGQYQLILNGELNHKVKGSIVKLIVTDKLGNEVASN